MRAGIASGLRKRRGHGGAARAPAADGPGAHGPLKRRSRPGGLASVRRVGAGRRPRLSDLGFRTSAQISAFVGPCGPRLGLRRRSRPASGPRRGSPDPRNGWGRKRLRRKRLRRKRLRRKRLRRSLRRSEPARSIRGPLPWRGRPRPPSCSRDSDSLRGAFATDCQALARSPRGTALAWTCKIVMLTRITVLSDWILLEHLV